MALLGTGPFWSALSLCLLVVDGAASGSSLFRHSRKPSSSVFRWQGSVVPLADFESARFLKSRRPQSLLEQHATRVQRQPPRHLPSSASRRGQARFSGSRNRGGANVRGAALGEGMTSRRKDAQDNAFVKQRRESLDHLLTWISSRFCNKACRTNPQGEDCRRDCVARLHRLYEASKSVQPGDENMIEFPALSNANMHLHSSNDHTKYDAMMFAGGVKLRGNTSFVARLCTHACHVGDPFFDSTVILGELEQHVALAAPLGPWKWRRAAEHWVPHSDGVLAKGDYSGPEDPRMDVLRGARFLTVSMNVPSMEAGCGKSPIGIHHMFFVPVDDQSKLKTCDLQVSGVDRCKTQKNWASLVPRGSNAVYYVYSIMPLQVIHFEPSSCATSWVELPKKSMASRFIDFDPTYAVHGGTRYVFGGQVTDGDLFWSVGHTPTPDYMPVLVGLLMRNATGSSPNPSFELVGISCPINISKRFRDKQSPSDEGWDDMLLITTSIVDFDPKADISTITFQVRDRDNYYSQLHGVGAWLHTAYDESRSGTVFACDQLH